MKEDLLDFKITESFDQISKIKKNTFKKKVAAACRQYTLSNLNNKKITSLIKFKNIKREVKFSDNTRFDFFLSNDKEKCFLEVKNVTLLREKKIAEFPDSITSRGTKHLNELCKAKKEGYQSYILYLIQRDDCDSFKIAEDIDKKYKDAFNKAVKSGVKILCYDCKLSNEEIKLNNQINYEY